MEYKVTQDTRYQDRYQIIATDLAGRNEIVATVRKANVSAKLNQLQYPFGC